MSVTSSTAFSAQIFFSSKSASVFPLTPNIFKSKIPHNLSFKNSSENLQYSRYFPIGKALKYVSKVTLPLICKEFSDILPETDL